MSGPLTRTLMSFAAFVLTAMTAHVFSLPADAGAGMTIISLI